MCRYCNLQRSPDGSSPWESSQFQAVFLAIRRSISRRVFRRVDSMHAFCSVYHCLSVCSRVCNSAIVMWITSLTGSVYHIVLRRQTNIIPFPVSHEPMWWLNIGVRMRFGYTGLTPLEHSLGDCRFELTSSCRLAVILSSRYLSN